jgi:hypothetical protein
LLRLITAIVFWCRGSHKANYALPQTIRASADLRPPVVSPLVKVVDDLH